MELKTSEVAGKKITYAEHRIEWNGKKESVWIKKLSFGEMLDLNQASAKMTMIGGVPKFDLDQTAMSTNCLLKSIVAAPFPVTMEGIRNLDNELGQELVSTFNIVNTPSDKKKDS